MTQLPHTFLEEIRAQLDADEYTRFLETTTLPHVTSLRLNPFRENAKILASPFIETPVPWEPFGYYTRPDVRPGLSLGHFCGAWYMQEASAMLSAMAIDVRPGMKVLDLCAAPGGKSGQLLRMLNREGILVSNEPDPARVKVLAGNLERLGATNSIITNEYPNKLETVFADFFDAILVDAPCSGEGMFRRDPGAVAEWNPGAPEFCHQRQLEILESASKMLKNGGQLVYSTCTFNRREDEDTIIEFLAVHPEFHTEEFGLPVIGASQSGMLRAWPQRIRGEGHFVCKLRKEGEQEVDPPKKKHIRGKTTVPTVTVDDIMKEILGVSAPDSITNMDILTRGDSIYAVPKGLPPLDKLRCPKPGLMLCKLEKNRKEPDHALAMALSAGDVPNTWEVTDKEAWRYLTGEVLECPLKGWALVTWNKLPLGWGKASSGQLKNHLPKGLRRPQGAPAQ